MVRRVVDAPWKRRIAPQFHAHWPESQALIDEMVVTLERRLAGRPSAPIEQKRLRRMAIQAAFADRTFQRMHAASSTSVGETERIRVTLEGALAYAGALVELRKAHLRD